jgi:hypothetical protein
MERGASQAGLVAPPPIDLAAMLRGEHQPAAPPPLVRIARDRKIPPPWPFKKVEELMNVRGIGEKNFLKLKPQLSVGPAKADNNAGR